MLGQRSGRQTGSGTSKVSDHHIVQVITNLSECNTLKDSYLVSSSLPALQLPVVVLSK